MTLTDQLSLWESEARDGCHKTVAQNGPGHPPGLHTPTVSRPKFTDTVSSCPSSKSWKKINVVGPA